MEQNAYDIPAHVRQTIEAEGYPVPFTMMRGYIGRWDAMLKAQGDFWHHREAEGGTVHEVNRMTVHPARRVVNEWASLLLNDRTEVSCDDSECTEWLRGFLDGINFYAKGQGVVADAFGLGTAAWSIWVDTAAGRLALRRYDARMVVPLSWDDDGVTECAFVTKAVVGGKAYDQLQLHVRGAGGYVIKTRFFREEDGEEAYFEGYLAELQTSCPTPTFAVVTPAIPNTRVDFSPYGQSIFADCEDVLKSVDLAYDAIFNEVSLSKMRVFMSDMLFEVEQGKRKNYIPFGRKDATVFRKVSADSDLIHEFAPQMRTQSQREAYRLAVQTMGDACGFGPQYFDVEKSGGLRTATEVSSDNMALMRNVRKHENLLQGAIAQVCRAVLCCAREFLGVPLPEEGAVRVSFDDSIITDTYTEKAQDLSEVNLVMQPWEYRAKWYGEDEGTARLNVPQAATVEFL